MIIDEEELSEKEIMNLLGYEYSTTYRCYMKDYEDGLITEIVTINRDDTVQMSYIKYGDWETETHGKCYKSFEEFFEYEGF